MKSVAILNTQQSTNMLLGERGGGTGLDVHPKLLGVISQAKDDDKCRLTAKVNSAVDCDASCSICLRHLAVDCGRVAAGW